MLVYFYQPTMETVGRLSIVGLATYSHVYSLIIKGAKHFCRYLFAGIFKSSNNGSSWTAVNNGLPQIQMSCH